VTKPLSVGLHLCARRKRAARLLRPGGRTAESGAFFHLLYFSFTTLTTTGFGDITPVTDQARSFVMIEEFAGVFFVGVLIARLAGLYPATARR
jgi:hypothetical protein